MLHVAVFCEGCIRGLTPDSKTLPLLLPANVASSALPTSSTLQSPRGEMSLRAPLPEHPDGAGPGGRAYAALAQETW